MDEQKLNPEELEIKNQEIENEIDEFDDEYESGGLLTSEKYEVPDSADAFVNTGEGKIINKEELSPFEIIKAVAKENGTQIQDPSKGCLHCYGRGFEGIDSETKMPVPCRCLFRGKTPAEKTNESLYDSGKLNSKITREQKRRMARFLRKQFKLQRKILERQKENGIDIDEEKKEPSKQLVNKVVKEYVKLNSIRKTAEIMKLTLTETKKILKNNKSKIEKMLKKETVNE